jgi:hypothetical protein
MALKIKIVQEKKNVDVFRYTTPKLNIVKENKNVDVFKKRL